MPDVAQEAMDALSKLHEPDKIELWNPEAPINTFWDISSQVRNRWRVGVAAVVQLEYIFLIQHNLVSLYVNICNVNYILNQI